MAGLSIPLDEVIHFDVVTHDPGTGGRVTATSITFDVFEEATDTAIRANQTLTERAGATGVFRGTDTISAANGYEVGKYYSIVAEATAGGVVGQAVALSFRVVPAESVAGVPEVDITHIMGTILTEGGAGRLAAAFIKLLDVATPTLVASDVMRGTDSANTDKTGYALSTAGILAVWHQALSAIVTASSVGKLLKDEITSVRMAVLTDWIDAGRLDTILDNILTDTAVIGALGIGLTDITDRLPAALTKGTADSGTTTTMVDSDRSEADTDYWVNQWIRFTSGNINGQVGLITGFTPASDTITFTPATTQAVANTITYEIIPASMVALIAATQTTIDVADGADGFVNTKAIVDLIFTDTAAIKADANELQTDWFDGGRLDLILDAIPTTAMRGTDSAFLASSAPTNFSSMVISVGGAVDSLVQGFLNNTIAETTADNIANNFEVFFDNGNSTSTSIIDDLENLNTTVGVAGAGLTDLGGMSTTMKGQVNTQVDTAFTTQMADSVPSDGTISTREQALYAVLQLLTDFSISGTTMTVKKVDGSTTLMTLTLAPDGTDPTSLTRAT